MNVLSVAVTSDPKMTLYDQLISPHDIGKNKHSTSMAQQVENIITCTVNSLTFSAFITRPNAPSVKLIIKYFFDLQKNKTSKWLQIDYFFCQLRSLIINYSGTLMTWAHYGTNQSYALLIGRKGDTAFGAFEGGVGVPTLTF